MPAPYSPYSYDLRTKTIEAVKQGKRNIQVCLTIINCFFELIINFKIFTFTNLIINIFLSHLKTP